LDNVDVAPPDILAELHPQFPVTERLDLNIAKRFAYRINDTLCKRWIGAT
jgi:hypothetical protein